MLLALRLASWTQHFFSEYPQKQVFRINVLAKGYSGISLENIKKMIAAFNGGFSKEFSVEKIKLSS